MQVTINGETKELGEPCNVAEMILQLGSKPSLVAVERNGEIVPKSMHESTMVAAGDTIELVRFIGGG